MNISLYVMILSSLLLNSNILGQSIYAEFAGNSAGYYSLNYEHRLKEAERKVWSLHGGISYYRVLDAYTKYSVPIGITYFSKPQSNHHKEVGACLNYVHGLVDNRANWILNGVQYSKALVLIAKVGYRYQKPEGGFLFKIYYAPLIVLKEFEKAPYYFYRESFYPINLGISFGYAF